MTPFPNALNALKQKLRQYPDLPHTIRERPSAWEVEVLSPDPEGFTVGIVAAGDCLTVHFEAWHEEFASEAEALNCFAFGLSERCRLKVSSRGDFDYAWTVEYRDGEGWLEYSTTGLIFSPFWRKKRLLTLQNHVLDPDETW